MAAFELAAALMGEEAILALTARWALPPQSRRAAIALFLAELGPGTGRGARRAGADTTCRGRHARLPGGARRPRRPGAERLRAGAAPGRGGPVLAGFQPARRRDRRGPDRGGGPRLRRPGGVDGLGPVDAAARTEPGPGALRVGRLDGRRARRRRIVKTIGDEVFFAAPTAEAACRIGLEICRAVAEDDVLPPGRGAVGIGPAFPREGDYFGPLVNLLARLAKVGAPGEMVATEAVAVHLSPEEWDLRPLEPTELRGIVEPVARSSWSAASPAPERPTGLTPWTALVTPRPPGTLPRPHARRKRRGWWDRRHDSPLPTWALIALSVAVVGGALQSSDDTSSSSGSERLGPHCHATLPAWGRRVCPAAAQSPLAERAGRPPRSNRPGAPPVRLPPRAPRRHPWEAAGGAPPGGSVPAMARASTPLSPLPEPSDTLSSGSVRGDKNSQPGCPHFAPSDVNTPDYC